MKRGLPALLPLLPMLASACVITVNTDGDDDTSTGDSSSSEDEAGTTSTTSGTDTSTDTSTETSTDTSTETGTETSTDTSTGTETGTGTDTTETGTDTGTETDTSTETGVIIEEPPPGFCGMEAGPSDPWIQLDQYGQVIDPNSNLELECGGQGSWMFRLNAVMGGFVPDAKLVVINATMDVEGYNIGPNGHFAEIPAQNWFLGCCPEDYDDYAYYCIYQQYITFFPPDPIDDLAVLDGLPATITVTTTTNEGDAVAEVDVTLWAVYEPDWELCLYEYYNPAPPPILDVPIPLP